MSSSSGWLHNASTGDDSMAGGVATDFVTQQGCGEVRENIRLLLGFREDQVALKWDGPVTFNAPCREGQHRTRPHLIDYCKAGIRIRNRRLHFR